MVLNGLKQASRKSSLGFDHIISSIGFKENTSDHYVYLWNSGIKFISLVLYIDGDVEYLAWDKQMLIALFVAYFILELC